MDNKANAGNGSKKFNETVGRATGKTEEDGGNVLAVVSKEVKAMVSKPSQAQIDAIMADESLEFAPQVHTLEEGDLIEGYLEGNGPGTEFTQKDQVTGQEVTRHVNTWILRHPTSGMRLSILSSTQLDDKLPPFKGSMVSIYRGKERKTNKGFRVTDYTVCGPPRADKKPRSWVKELAPIDVESRELPASATTPQLGAGQPDGEDAVA